MPRFRAALAALLVVPVVGCGSLTAARASLPTIESAVVVFPVNGSPPYAPTAIDLASASAVAIDPTLTFDVAFNLDTTTGTITVLPVRQLATQLAAVHQVALEKLTTPYDSLTSAPHSGYTTDSSLVVSTGTTTAIAINNPTYCYGSLLSNTFYAKMVVDSVDAQHALHVRITVDPNCGFYGLTLGVPKA